MAEAEKLALEERGWLLDAALSPLDGDDGLSEVVPWCVAEVLLRLADLRERHRSRSSGGIVGPFLMAAIDFLVERTRFNDTLTY